MVTPTESSQDRIVYLSSLESTRLEPVRSCHLIELLHFDTGKQAVRAVIDPVVIGQDFDRGDDISHVILVARHEGVTLDPLSEYPCFVAVAIAAVGFESLRSPIRSDDLKVIGWGELYRTHDDAAQHRFGAAD